jgi:phosphoglycolate phosphatase-like HAD superfamily hydrolase
MEGVIILFDLDGTLVESTPGMLLSLLAAFNECSVVPSH